MAVISVVLAVICYKDGWDKYRWCPRWKHVLSLSLARVYLFFRVSAICAVKPQKGAMRRDEHRRTPLGLGAQSLARVLVALPLVFVRFWRSAR